MAPTLEHGSQISAGAWEPDQSMGARSTPVTYRYFRNDAEGFRHQDGAPYQIGEVITDRPVDRENPTSITYGVGNATTLIDADKPFAAGGTYLPDYVPVLVDPLRFEAAAGR